jgi:bifunctional UDP-N-acetylglucosamine pyrophosphorylase/glucosamine-1-phosphate N-acetyltransferase
MNEQDKINQEKQQKVAALYALEQAKAEARLARNLELAAGGVEFVDINQAYIDEGVTIGAGTVIGPCVTIEGNTTIGKDTFIGQNTKIKDATIGDGVNIESSVILEASIGDNTKVGPFAYLRPGTSVGNNCRVGDFVEIKNSSLGDGTKAAHLTYIGDSDLGKDINLGCGVVFVNYDGKNKYRSVIKDGAFIGCNVNIVSPVTVGEKAYIGAATTVTKDVEDGVLLVGRPQNKTIPGWVKRTGLLDKKKK